MKKLKLILLLCAALISAGAWAEVTISLPASADPTSDNNFYFYNIGADAYLTSGNSWGTEATLTDLAKTNDFKWVTSTNLSDSWIHQISRESAKDLFCPADNEDVYCNNNTNGRWAFTASGNYYTIKNTTKNTDKYLARDGVSRAKNNSTTLNDDAKWILVTEANIDKFVAQVALYKKVVAANAINASALASAITNAETAYKAGDATVESLTAAATTLQGAINSYLINNASEVSPVDITAFGKNLSFTGEGSTTQQEAVPGWTCTTGAANYCVYPDGVHIVFENWAGSLTVDGTMTQTWGNMPAGKYQVTMVGGWSRTAGYAAVYIANGTQALAETSRTNDVEVTAQGTLSSTGDLQFGLKVTTATDWVGFSSIKSVKYLGPDLSAMAATWTALKATGTAALNSTGGTDYSHVTGVERTNLATALAQTPEDVATYVAYDNAITQLQAALDAFTAAKTAYDALATAIATGDALVSPITLVAAPLADAKAVAADGSATAESAATAAADLNYAISMNNATPASPVTVRIVNGDCESGDTGWTRTISTYSSYGSHGANAGALFNGNQMEIWRNEAYGQLTSGSISQTLSNMPAGYYKLTASVNAVLQSNEANTEGVSLMLGSNKQPVQSLNGVGQRISVSYALASEGDLELGINKYQGSANWIAFDNMELKYYGTSAPTTQSVSVGDITSMINSEFETNADGWEGYTAYPSLERSWKANGPNKFIERGSNGEIYCKLENMPAGVYKVVFAARSYVGGVQAATVAGKMGTIYTGVGDNDTEIAQINKNGVQMPFSDLGGFAGANSKGYRWMSATGTLVEDGDLYIGMMSKGTNWMAIDDVHLYYLGATDDGTVVSLNNLEDDATVAAGKVVTADISVANPNVIISSSAAINGANGAINNNLVSGTVSNLVLYDDYAYTSTDDFTATDVKIYRTLTANRWSTAVYPFAVSGVDNIATLKSYADGTLTFNGEATTSVANQPFLMRSTSGATEINLSSVAVAATTANPTKTVDTYASLIGAYAATDITNAEKNYVLSNNTIYPVGTAGATINPYRAYIQVTDGGAARALRFVIDGEEATAIEGIKAVTGNDEGEAFNLAGQRVKNMKKGLYIRNGKKIVVK